MNNVDFEVSYKVRTSVYLSDEVLRGAHYYKEVAINTDNI